MLNCRRSGHSPRSQESPDTIRDPQRRRAGRRRCLVGRRRGRDRRARGRVRLRQERERAQHHAARCRPGRPHRRWPDSLQGTGPPAAVRGRDAPRARPRDRDGLPGADDLAQSGAHDRAPAHRGARDPAEDVAGRGTPSLILADEPTTALDVTIQAQILELMKDLSRRFGVAMLIITHNLGVVARYADRVNVMYAGRIIERGTARELYANPRHPYTLGLLRSVPRLDEPRRARLDPIEGQPP